MLGNEAPLVIKRSLKEHNRKRAARLSRFLAVQLENFITLSSGYDMDDQERKRILFRYLEEKISEWKLLHAAGPRLSMAEVDEKIQHAASSYNECLNDLRTANLVQSLDKVKNIYSKYGVYGSPDKHDAYELRKVESVLYKFIEQNLKGNVRNAERLIDSARPIETRIPQLIQAIPVEEDQPLISTLVAKFLEEKSARLAPKTLMGYKTDLAIFQSNTDDIPINKFRIADLNDFRDKLKILPKHNNKTGSPISATRANNIIGSLSAFMGWCKDLGYIDSNIALNKKIPVPKNEGNRDRFSDEQLLMIFSHDRFVNPDKKKMYHYWVPILAYYHGMRLNEICLLRKKDVYKHGDIWAISINEDSRELKTDSAIRNIPIHDHVIQLGFLDYVNSCKHEHLFKTGRKGDNYADTIGKSFGRFKTSLGFQKNIVFHSFRHVFADLCKQSRIELSLIKEFMGHSLSDITLDTYSKRYTPDILKRDLLENIKFPVCLPDIIGDSHVR
jgi:integrase